MLVPGFRRQLPPFYSAAMLPRAGYELWIFGGVDGQVRAYDGVNLISLRSGTKDWGSDFAAVSSRCEIGMQLLVSAASDDLAPDSLRAVEIADREPAVVSPPVAFEGPVTALWSTADSSAAIAVVHNAQTENYEAYSVSVACNQ